MGCAEVLQLASKYMQIKQEKMTSIHLFLCEMLHLKVTSLLLKKLIDCPENVNVINMSITKREKTLVDIRDRHQPETDIYWPFYTLLHAIWPPKHTRCANKLANTMETADLETYWIPTWLLAYLVKFDHSAASATLIS